MRILIISNLVPLPPNSGGRLRQYHLLHRIVAAGKHEVSYACHLWDDDDKAALPELRKLCRHVITGWVRRKPYARRLPVMASFLLKGRPPELAFWRSAELARKIGKLLSNEEFDVVQIEESLMASYLDAVPATCTARKILVFHNIGFDQFSKLASICPGSKGWWHRFGGLIYSRWEPELTKRFDRCITVCDRDRDLLTERAGADRKVAVVPNGADIGACRPLGDPETPPSFLLIGDMNYEPCIDAARRFAMEILPRIRRRIDGATFRIVGREPSRAVRRLRGESVDVTGAVKEVAPWYEKCAACVVPLRAGGGTRLKILEAMALGRPVVSTSIGAEGLDVRHGEHLLIGDDDESFAGEAVRAARGGDEIAGMIERARRLVASKYDWDGIAVRQNRIYEEMSR